MKSYLKFALTTIALVTAVPAFAQDGTSPIIGAWQMTSLQFTNPEGKVVDVPYSGQLVFADTGTLSVQAMDANPDAKPTTYTANAYEAYYGPVKIDNTAKTFTITVKSSLVRDLIGQELVRKFEVTGDQLVISPVDPSETWRVSYNRQN